MKKIRFLCLLILPVAVLAIILLTPCGISDNIIGTWERFVDVNNPFTDVIQFNPDGTYERILEFADGSRSETGVFEIRNRRIWLVPGTHFQYYRYRNGALEAIHDSGGVVTFNRSEYGE